MPAVGAGRTRATAWHALRASFGPHGVAEIPLSPVLANIQRQMLADSGRLVRWQLRVDAGETAWTVRRMKSLAYCSGRGQWTRSSRRVPRRCALCAATTAWSSRGRDLRALRPAAQAYAEAYRELLAWQLRQAERATRRSARRLLADLAAMLPG